MFDPTKWYGTRLLGNLPGVIPVENPVIQGENLLSILLAMGYRQELNTSGFTYNMATLEDLGLQHDHLHMVRQIQTQRGETFGVISFPLFTTYAAEWEIGYDHRAERLSFKVRIPHSFFQIVPAPGLKYNERRQSIVEMYKAVQNDIARAENELVSVLVRGTRRNLPYQIDGVRRIEWNSANGPAYNQAWMYLESEEAKIAWRDILVVNSIESYAPECQQDVKRIWKRYCR